MSILCSNQSIVVVNSIFSCDCKYSSTPAQNMSKYFLRLQYQYCTPQPTKILQYCEFFPIFTLPPLRSETEAIWLACETGISINKTNKEYQGSGLRNEIQDIIEHCQELLDSGNFDNLVDSYSLFLLLWSPQLLLQIFSWGTWLRPKVFAFI